MSLEFAPLASLFPTVRKPILRSFLLSFQKRLELNAKKSLFERVANLFSVTHSGGEGEGCSSFEGFFIIRRVFHHSGTQFRLDLFWKFFSPHLHLQGICCAR